MEATSPTRWHGLDLIRLVCFFCIVEFHLELFYFGQPNAAYKNKSLIVWAIDAFAHNLMISGFVIAFLSTLLLALNKKPGGGKWRLFSVLAFGWLVLSVSSANPIWETWDVFGLLFIGIGSAMLLDVIGLVPVRMAGCIGYLMLWFPFWDSAPYLPPGFDSLKQVLGVSDCQVGEVAEWPILPWIGLVWFAYWIGTELRHCRMSNRLDQLKIKPAEGLIWVLLLGASVPALGTYANVRIGQFFSCDAYRQPPNVFWSHFIWVLACVRASFDPRVQGYLARQKWALRISGLAISRRFWLAYVLQYAYGNFIAGAVTTWQESGDPAFALWEPAIVEFMALTAILQNEFLTFKADQLLRRISSWWTKRRNIVSPNAAETSP